MIGTHGCLVHGIGIWTFWYMDHVVFHDGTMYLDHVVFHDGTMYLDHVVFHDGTIYLDHVVFHDGTIYLDHVMFEDGTMYLRNSSLSVISHGSRASKDGTSSCDYRTIM